MLLESDKIIIGKKFRAYRKNKKLTQAELAEQVGLNEKQISRIEAGLNYPTYLTFTKLINILNINIEDFAVQTPISINPLQEEIIHIIKNSNDLELKTYLDLLKSLKKNLKILQK